MKSAAGVDGQLTNFWMQACYSSLLSNPDFSSSLKLCLWAMFLSVPRYMYWCSAASQVKWNHCFCRLFCVHHIYTFTHGDIPHIKRNPHQLWNFSWFFPIIFKFPNFFQVFQVDGHFVNAACECMKHVFYTKWSDSELWYLACRSVTGLSWHTSPIA